MGSLAQVSMLRLALVCALVAVGLSAPAVPKSWTGHLSNLLVDSTAYNSADGVTTTNCQCNGCGGPDHPSTTASERTNRHYTEADPAVWGHTSQAYSNDPAKGCAAACFRNETDNHAGTPSEAHSYPNNRASTSHKGCKVSLYNSETKRCFLYDHGMTSITNQGASKFTCWASQHECHSNANCQHHNPTPVPSLSPTPSPTPSPTRSPTRPPTHAPTGVPETVNGWVKGANGATCDATCSGQGKSCNNGPMSALTSWDKVRNAFAAAGYSCRGAHGARNYAGTPFSTARSDDCAPVSSGTVVCNSNAAGHHAPLCCCVNSGQTASNVCPITG